MTIGKKKRVEILKFLEPFKVLIEKSVSDLNSVKRDFQDDSIFYYSNNHFDKEIEILIQQIESRMLNHYEQIYNRTNKDISIKELKERAFNKLDNYYILNKEEEILSETLIDYSEEGSETEYRDYFAELSPLKNNELVDSILKEEFSLTDSEIKKINEELGYSFEYNTMDPYSEWKNYCFILDMNKVFDYVKELKANPANRLGM